MRRLKRQQKSIPITSLDASGLLHWLIGLDVPDTSFDDDVSTYTTMHRGATFTTQPMKTEKRERAR